MKRYITRTIVLLFAGLLVSCGGGGGSSSGGGSPAATNNGSSGTGDNGNPGNGSGGGAGTPPSAGLHFEESDTSVVTLSGDWTPSGSGLGWSGGAARQSTMTGAQASFIFTGTAVTWIGSRGRTSGIAMVSVDGGTTRGKDLFEVDLYASPNDEIRTPVIRLDGLSDSQHTLTIEVTGRKNPDATSNVVVVDAFDVQAQVVSHLQEADPDAQFSASWTDASSGFKWSGGGVSNGTEPQILAKVTQTAGATATLAFRGTSIRWIGYSGPDAGIAHVRVVRKVDGNLMSEADVDTYSPTQKVQEVVFTSPALADTDYTLTIEATGRKNDASSAAQIFVDAFDVTTPGRRYQEDYKSANPNDPKITYTGTWNLHNNARVWSEGASATTNEAGASATFSFIGTSVSWIGCEKSSIGKADIFLDDVRVEKDFDMRQNVGTEGYQRTIYRADGLTNGRHTLRIVNTSTNGAFVVVDAFDVR